MAESRPIAPVVTPLDPVAQDFYALSAQLSAVEQRMAVRDGNVANEVNALLNSALPPLQRIASLEESMGSLARQVLVIQEAAHSTAGNLANADNQITNAREQLTSVDRKVAIAQGWLEDIGNEVSSAREDLASVSGRLANTENGLANYASHLASIDRRISEAVGQVEATAQASQRMVESLGHMGGRLANTDNRLENGMLTVVQLDARVSALQGALANLDNRVCNAQATLLGVVNSLAAIAASVATVAEGAARNDELRERMTLLVARAAAALSSRANASRTPSPPRVAPPRACPSLKQQMSAMEKAAPANFSTWHRAYEVGVAEGQRTVEGNLSHDGHVGATYFGMFINIHGRGRLLDIGCGPLPLPSYLADWPIDALAGIDPQPPFDVPHPFPFAISFAETLPWPDASFETVVIGTSLDHIYLLDRALAEIKRVLTPRGRLLIWTAMLDQSTPYDPYKEAIVAPDQFHLFHPGRNWFYNLFEADYRLIERIATVANAEFLAFERR